VVLTLLALCALGFLIVCVRPVWVGQQTARWVLRFHGVKSGWTMIDGQRIHYYEAKPKGTARPVPVVLVHGLGGRGEDWVNYLPALAAQGYHVYAPELLGYGRSARPHDATYSIPQEEGVVAKFMEDRGIQQADVLGWSMGGWITLKLALDKPQMVRRVMLIDAAGIYFHPEMPLSLFAPNSEAELQELFHYLEPGDRTLPHLVARDALRNLQRNAWVVNRSALAMTSGTDLLDFRLDELRQPTLIVWGDSDRLIPDDVGRRMHTLIPQSQYVELKGCGHMVPVECSKQSLVPVEEFLAGE
jgi:pimeloyl-ACP methyl ester carboxylesterase